jgi:hypothetical protein
VNSGTRDEYAVPAPPVALVVLTCYISGVKSFHAHINRHFILITHPC